MTDDQGIPIPATRLFQINEDDLADLERTLPRILDAAYATLDNRQRVMWRRVRDIVSNVRWNYGPPLEVHVIKCDEPDQP